MVLGRDAIICTYNKQFELIMYVIMYEYVQGRDDFFLA